MKKVIAYSALLAISYFIALIAQIPAGYLYQQLVPKKMPVIITHLEGSLWSGQAQQLQYQDIKLGPIQWHINWQPLLSGKIGYHLTWQMNKQKSSADITADQHQNIWIKDLQSQIPLTTLSPLLKSMGLKLSGSVYIDMPEIHIHARKLITASGLIETHPTNIHAQQEIKLGRMLIKVDNQKDNINAKLTSDSKIIDIRSNTRLKPSGQFRTTGSIKSLNPQSPLNNMISMMGKPNKEGRINFVFSGRLPRL